jgi:EmrB/QacA subfamily drug resistance transporter
MEFKIEQNNNDKSRWIILAVVLIGPFMATLDSSIVNVALPDMATRLYVGIDTIQWVVTSYLIVVSSSILVFGRISDIKGKKNIYQYGFLVFASGSLLCGISKTVQFLVLSRVIQAIGAAMTMSCSQAIITRTFPSNERGRALGLSGTTVALGTMVGPPLGGIMVGALNWESIFLINVPIGIIAFFLGAKILPKDHIKESDETFDFKGAVIFAVSIISLFWGVLSGEVLGWRSIYIILSFVVAIISIIMFFSLEKKVKHPMLDLSIFRNKLFTVSIFCGFVSFMAIFCTNIIHPFYLQYVLNMSPGGAGILMIIYPVTVAVVAPISGYLSDKIGSEILTLIGLIITAVGLVAMSLLKSTSSYIDIIFRMAVIGFGNGLFQSPNNSLVMSTVSKNKLGIAGSVNALVRNLGMVFGIGFSVSLLYNRMSTRIGYKVESYVPGRPDVFIYAMQFVYVSAAFICLIGIILTFLRLKDKKSTK